MNSNGTNGTAVALAWPDTWCKQPGSWYDEITALLGFNRRHYYQVGHAAVLLIKDHCTQVNYYDFGRYHTPYQTGRVRSALTDHELRVATCAYTSNKQLTNLGDILQELQSNKACHGEGKMRAGQTRIYFDEAQKKALSLQQSSPLPYGPFIWGGTNCSRFVNAVIRAGKPVLGEQVMLHLTLSPTPAWNVKSLKNNICIDQTENREHKWKKGKEQPQKATQKNDDRKNKPALPPEGFNLNGTLAAPSQASKLPGGVKWLAGEGAGSWFYIKEYQKSYRITKYDPSGSIECENLFKADQTFYPNQDFDLAYLSHSMQVKVFQNRRLINFTHINEE